MAVTGLASTQAPVTYDYATVTYDPATGAQTSAVETGTGTAAGIAVNPAGTGLYVVGSAGTVAYALVG